MENEIIGTILCVVGLLIFGISFSILVIINDRNKLKQKKMKGETIEVSKGRLVELLKEERELYMLKNRDMTSSEEWDIYNELDTKSDDDLIKSHL